jgi:hypothetical protein
MSERHSVGASRVLGSANVESTERGELAIELAVAGESYGVAVDIDAGPIAATAVLDDERARELYQQLGEYIDTIDSAREEPVPVDVNPGP